MESEQSTVAHRVTCSGIGLHGGHEVEIVLCPAPPDSGIVFVAHRRPDADERRGPSHSDQPVEIPALTEGVVSSARATTLSDARGTSISTVEHLLASLYALGIDNARIEVWGSEIPMLDGSALPFVEWIRSAGRTFQGQPSVEYAVLHPLEFCDGARSIRVEPATDLRISYAIDFDHPSIGRQQFEMPSLDAEFFETQIAGARTFGFEHEISSLRAAGLAIGGSFENALVLGAEGVLNASGLRWPDEFVRHKVIDLLGDLSLLGGRLRGHIQVERGGHGLHHTLVKGLQKTEGLLKSTTGRNGDGEKSTDSRARSSSSCSVRSTASSNSSESKPASSRVQSLA